ncbi:MAG: 50S ribosomal protein L24 [Bacteriovoracaceae bacterium]|nr:50S ribosomal protein L24 [Bacteriovoracaceae bacterium]
MQKLKVGDEVIVLAGKNKDKTGKVKQINFKTNRVLVEGVNVVKKSFRPNQQFPEGGFLDLEKPLHISNVAVMSPKTKKATRVRIEVRDGKTVRVATKCGSVL